MGSSNILKLFLLIIQVRLSFSLLKGNETDRLSLLAFKAQITDDPLHVLSSWNESIHFCRWSGVTCGRKHQRVIELDLNSARLAGRLSPHIGNLSFLRKMNLENNSLSYEIPREIVRLSRLRLFSLRSNLFTGEIPANISGCSSLEGLDFGGNNLTGKLPEGLGSLKNLRILTFQQNSIVGEIPFSFGNLSSLEVLGGSDNSLVGIIPEGMGKLQRLNFFSLGANNLRGTVPSSMYNLSSLAVFSVPVNNLHGNLPPDIGITLPNLQILRFHSNQFAGQIPVSLSNASNLLILHLARNKFTGKVPALPNVNNLQGLAINENNLGNGEDDDLIFLYPLANNTSLGYLIISDNNFGGVLPETLSNFSTKISKIGFGRNRIHGSIPTEIGNLIRLEALGFESNQLTGNIPSSIGKLQMLNDLYLNDNKISGTIPSSLGNLSSLGRFSLRNNNLQGSIPSSLGNCQKLLYMALAGNNLSGLVPKEVISIASLALMLDLSENQLTGSLPMEVGKLVNLGYLDVSNNRLSGEIPSALGSCLSLESLYLQGNILKGNIPQSLSSLRAIQSLNLSQNNLTGRIPEYFGNFKLLKNLDLSFNEFEGEVPVQGVFENASAISVSGNKKLCGGIPHLGLPRCASTKSKSSSKLILIIAVTFGCLGVVLMTSFLLVCCLRKSKNKEASEASMEASLWKVTYEDLFKATDGFSSSKLLGVGSFGSVYEGVFKPDETVVAVKVLNLNHKGASKSFMAECKALTNIRHRNLVKVITACSSIDFQGNDFKALLYEFMVNGNLDEWLHPVPGLEQARNVGKLSLIQRLNIAIDVASALEYLHHHCQMPVVHCDLKPSNVLLDRDMTAHVGDFGLARFLTEASHQLSFNQSSSIGIKGTIGYAPPEYGMGSEVSTHGDVYSYGILVLEMFTGKRPTDDMFKDGLNLHNFAKIALPNRVADVVDPVLLIDDEETNTNDWTNGMTRSREVLEEALTSIFEVGIHCSAALPTHRMEISNAVAQLHRVRAVVLGAAARKEA